MGRRSLKAERRSLELRVRRWRKHQASIMRHMYMREGKLIARLKAGVRRSRERLARRRARWAEELARLKAKQRREKRANHLRLEKIRVLKVEIKRERTAGKLKRKSMDAKWKHMFAERKKKGEEQLKKLNAIKMRDLRRLRRERRGVAYWRGEISSLKNKLSEEHIRYEREMHRVRVLKRRRTVLFKRLKHVRWKVKRFSHMVFVAKKAILKSHKVQDRLARALKALRKKQKRWRALKLKRAIQEKRLQHWRYKVLLMRRRVKVERLKLHRMGHPRLAMYRSQLRHRISVERHLRLRLAHRVRKLKHLRRRLRRLVRRQAIEEKKIRYVVARVKQLTEKVHKVRNTIVHLKVVVRFAMKSLKKNGRAVRNKKHGIEMLRRKLRRAKEKLAVEAQKEKKFSVQIKHERYWNERRNLKLRSLRRRLRAIRKTNRLLYIREKHIKTILLVEARRIRHARAELRTVNRRYALRLREQRRRDQAQHRHILSLMHKLKEEQDGLRRIEKKNAAWHARAKLIALLRRERRRRLRQHKEMSKLQTKLRHAVSEEKLAERELHKQMKLARHLKKIFGCGRMRT